MEEDTSVATRRRLRPRKPMPLRLWSTEFLMQATLMVIQRWDRLSAVEQDRFKELMRRGGEHPEKALPPVEYRELRILWKRLEVRGLLREAISIATR